MPAEDEQLKQALQQPCIADTSLLSNFVHIGQAQLLNRLLKQSVFLTPTVLDPEELNKSLWKEKEPISEFLKPYYTVLHGDYSSLYSTRVPHIEQFMQSQGDLWKPISLSLNELVFASELADREIQRKVKEASPEVKGRIRIHAGEAETAAVAISRNMTFLVDDRSAVTVVRTLYPEVKIIQSCQLLAYGARINLITCEDAQLLFNQKIIKDLNFYAQRNKGTEQLTLLCEPARCDWVDVAN